jgi:hypothetical protein
MPEALRFHRSSAEVERTQAGVLRRIIDENRTSWFGTTNRFSAVDGVDQFRSRVPLSTYDDYAEPIDRISRGEQGVLTAERVLLLEPTGGTTSSEKLAPYTTGLRRQFQRAVRAWIADLFWRRPAVRRGAAYWSITPLACRERITPGGLRIGFHDDSQYLATAEQMLLLGAMAVAPAVARCESVASAFYATSFLLLRSRSLALVSIWSPTFLTELAAFMREHAAELCRDVAVGTISRPMPAALARQFRPLPDRAVQAASVLESRTPQAGWAHQLWPELALVSCWCDGPSAIFADNLREQLPGVEFQPKGLLATEAAVSIPLLGHPGAALAVRSHFFEFLPVVQDGQPVGRETLLAHELRQGERYRVVVTTAGGFYRYQMQDEVEVVGFHREIPLIRFLGKCDRTSDMVGEKLSEAQVHFALRRALSRLETHVHHAEVVAELTPRPSYRLRIVAAESSRAMEVQRRLGQELDEALRANPGYAYARDLGQLDPVQVQVVIRQEPDAETTRRAIEPSGDKQRYGSKKPRVLFGVRDAPSNFPSGE